MHAPSRSDRQVGLSLAEKEVLFRISLAGGSMRMTELAQALLFTAGGTTREGTCAATLSEVARRG